ncbi:hypothetical protein I7I48_03614 [Histoplasma ohiense]|nr:hypothetical protein I7I48_03614 [Histoplasma ohiense (nom. inval.)]
MPGRSNLIKYILTLVQSLPALLFLLYFFYLVDLPYPYSLVNIWFDFLHFECAWPTLPKLANSFTMIHLQHTTETPSNIQKVNSNLCVGGFSISSICAMKTHSEKGSAFIYLFILSI